MHAVTSSSTLTCTQLRNAHELMMGKVAEKMSDNHFNLESALGEALERHTLAGLLVQSGMATGRSSPPPKEKEKEKEKKAGEQRTPSKHEGDLERQIENLKKKLKGGDGGGGGGGTRSLCNAFNGQAGCRNPPERCRYVHRCSLCGSESHGRPTCPKGQRG